MNLTFSDMGSQNLLTGARIYRMGCFEAVAGILVLYISVGMQKNKGTEPYGYNTALLLSPAPEPQKA